jgi:hypothetical protein
MKRALIICYSQAGQTQRAVESVTKGIKNSLSCDVVHVEPLEKFAFPWSMRNFFRAMPRCVQGLAPQIKPLKVNWDDYDIIFLAYQVWFLSPSLPIQGFLQSHSAAGLKGKTVVTITTCRNLWRSAARSVSQALKQLGAKHLGQITVCELSPLWASFVTTPRWMLTGKKSAFWFFPAAGIADQEFVKLEEKAQTLARDFSSGLPITDSHLGSNLNRPSLEMMDAIGYPFFRFWSALILRVAPRANAWQDFWLLLFRINLVLLIVCAAPCTRIFEIYASFHQRNKFLLSERSSH